MKIHVLQHVPFETAANIGPWAKERGHTLSVSRLYSPHTLPAVEELDWLVVMGGPMGANDDDQYRWMNGEKCLIGEVIESGKPVLGICLGAQLIANVLGARVYPNPVKEIGWLDVNLMPSAVDSSLLTGLPQVFQPLHWHGDTFDLPSGCLHLAQSANCKNQAFQYGENVLGLQFHLEIGLQQAKELTDACAPELVPSKTVQRAEQILGNSAGFSSCETYLRAVLDNCARA